MHSKYVNRGLYINVTVSGISIAIFQLMRGFIPNVYIMMAKNQYVLTNWVKWSRTILRVNGNRYINSFKIS